MAIVLFFLVLFHGVFQIDGHPKGFQVAKPSPAQAKWLEDEIGAIIHFNMQTFNKSMKPGDVAPPNTFNPSNLSVDQWVDTAVSFGAKWVTLTFSHASGFLLWPSKSYNYTLRNTRWRNGTGDIALDFINSCKKHGVEYGYFYSVPNNFFLDVRNFHPRNSSEVPRYHSTVIQHITELLNPTSKYKNPLYMFLDAGVEQGAIPDIGPIIDKFAKNTVCDECPFFHVGNSLRWVGNEMAVVPLPNWYAIETGKCGAYRQGNEPGDPRGGEFCPNSCDTVVREHYWFWWNNTEQHLKTPQRLIQEYLTSVGRGCTMLLDMNPDPRGLVPDPDVKVYHAMGEGIKLLYKQPVLVKTNVTLKILTPVTYEVNIKSVTNGSVVLREDIANNGQLVERYAVFIIIREGYIEIDGTSIGNKRIHPFPPEVRGKEVLGLEIKITKLVVGGEVLMREIAMYDWTEAAKKGFVGSETSTSVVV